MDCDHRDYRLIEIHIGAGISRIDNICDSDECCLVLGEVTPLDQMYFEQTYCVGANRYRITVEGIPF